MSPQPLKKQALLPRIDGIQKDIEKLKALGKLSFGVFSQEPNFIQAQYYLRRALEGVFNIGSHILARIPGGRAMEYKAIAKKLGELGIVDKQFADNQLKNMAGYRNRLTHFYAEITPEELHAIIQNNLGDFTAYLESIKKLFEAPERFNLSIE